MAEPFWNVLFTLQTEWPTDVANPEGYEALDWYREGIMPFIPPVGMMINCGDGELRRVDEVYWIVEKPGLIEVNFEDDFPAVSLRKRSWFESYGWKSKDLPKLKKQRKSKKAVANG